jgi:hypothetical protein
MDVIAIATIVPSKLHPNDTLENLGGLRKLRATDYVKMKLRKSKYRFMTADGVPFAGFGKWRKLGVEVEALYLWKLTSGHSPFPKKRPGSAVSTTTAVGFSVMSVRCPSDDLRLRCRDSVDAHAAEDRFELTDKKSASDAAKYFFASLKSFLEQEGGFRHALVSGHDFERWLLKTSKAMAVSRNFARGRERLSGAFARDEAILDMLDDPGHWPEGAGLYCVVVTGDLIVNRPRFQCQPLTNADDEIEALGLNILGLSFVLLLEAPDVAKYPFLSEARYRPGRIVISYPGSTHWLTMSWEDGNKHDDLTVQHMQRLPP